MIAIILFGVKCGYRRYIKIIVVNMSQVNFECDICYEKFEEVGPLAPLIIPCGHTYCMSCIENLHSHVCPECKNPIHEKGESFVDLPRNLYIIRCMNQIGQKSPSKSKVDSKKKKSAGVPKVKPAGQRVLFKKLDRALSNTLPSTTSNSQQMLEERLFLLNLSRICRERKAEDTNFNTKRFVTQGLISKFGEETARRILREVFGRIQVLRDRSTLPVSHEVSVSS